MCHFASKLINNCCEADIPHVAKIFMYVHVKKTSLTQ